MKDNKILCEECGREITEEISDKYNGLCQSCYEELEEDDDDESTYTIKNRVASFFYSLSSIILFISVLIAIISFSDNNPLIGTIAIITGIISPMFLYGFGEIIQLLEDIKNK